MIPSSYHRLVGNKHALRAKSTIWNDPTTSLARARETRPCILTDIPSFEDKEAAVFREVVG